MPREARKAMAAVMRRVTKDMVVDRELDANNSDYSLYSKLNKLTTLIKILFIRHENRKISIYLK